MRKVVFANEGIYHIFNRSIEQRPVFTTKREYNRATLTFDFYRFKSPPLRLAKFLQLEKTAREIFFINLKKADKQVEIISYCLMPNHFHFLLRQTSENGITKFLSNFANSYTRYFNTKQKRKGPLFEGIFKAVYIETDEQLIHVSRYIHLNPIASFLIKENDLDFYPWSSFPEFLNESTDVICNKSTILNFFPSKKKYRQFVHDRIDYAQKLEKIKHLILE